MRWHTGRAAGQAERSALLAAAMQWAGWKWLHSRPGAAARAAADLRCVQLDGRPRPKPLDRRAMARAAS